MNKNQPSKPSKPADPKRFKDFRSELEDGTGFKVLGSNHVFLYDKNGGWFDEYGNYYNKDGVPKPAPGSEEETKENTESQGKGEEFEIRVWNLPYNTTEEDFEKFLTEKKIEWIYFEFEYNAQDKFNGTAYLTLDQANADKFWELEGTQYNGRDLRMEEYYEEDEEEEDPADILAKEYVHGVEAEEDPLDHYEDLYLNTENKQIIESYPKDKEIQITAWNFPYSTTEDDFEKLMVEKKIDWILFEFELNAQDKFNGRVHLTFDRANAEKFIELNGQPFNGRDIKIQVEKAASVEIEGEDAEGDDEEEEEEDGEEGVEGVEGEEGEKAEKADKDPAPETQ